MRMGNSMSGISGKRIHQIHRYGGLILGLWILAMCLSGAVLVYAPEIEMAAARSNAPGAGSIRLEHVVQTVMSRFPGFQLRDIRFNSAGAAKEFHIQAQRDRSQAPRTNATESRSGRNDLHVVVEPGWAGMLLRSMWVAAGLAPGVLVITGFILWWNRTVLRRRASTLRSPSSSRLRRAAVFGLALLFFVFPVSARETSVAGQVLDETGAAVAWAKITLFASPERMARTDSEGRFSIPQVAPGLYILKIEAAGFNPLNEQVRPGLDLKFILRVAPVLETVVVNAGTMDQLRLEELASTTGIGSADISKRNNRRLSDVVARMPGVFLTGPPGGDKDVRIRGLDKEFSRTQVDGIVIPDGGEKREFQLNRIPSSIVDAVRIIRNPTAEYESDGLAGRVDVQTRPIPDALTLSGRIAYGGRRSPDNGITQGQVTAGSRFHRNLGFFGGFDYLNDHLPIDRDKLWSTGTLESEDEKQRQRSRNFFGDFGVYASRFGEWHFKPVVLDFTTDMNYCQASGNGTNPSSNPKVVRPTFRSTNFRCFH
jgi:hypothetical protein